MHTYLSVIKINEFETQFWVNKMNSNKCGKINLYNKKNSKQVKKKQQPNNYVNETNQSWFPLLSVDNQSIVKQGEQLIGPEAMTKAVLKHSWNSLFFLLSYKWQFSWEDRALSEKNATTCAQPFSLRNSHLRSSSAQMGCRVLWPQLL